MPVRERQLSIVHQCPLIGSLASTSSVDFRGVEFTDEKLIDSKDGNGDIFINLLPSDAVDEVPKGPETIEKLEETRRIMRKIDLRLMPVCSLLFLLSFLDRTAIGNAAIAGMPKELKLSPSEFSLALTLFFIPYALLEPLYALAVQRWGARFITALAVTSWGITICLTGFVQNGAGLIATRVLLGVAEAALIPAMTFLISVVYPNSYISIRFGIFLGASTLSGAFGGLLSYALTPVHWAGFSGWRWLFFLLGFFTIAVGAATYFLLIDSVDEAKFLTPDEKTYIKDRLKFDCTDVPMNNQFDWKFVRAGFCDWKPYVGIATLVGIVNGLYAISLVLPTILHVSLGYSPLRADLLTVPVYAVSTVFMLVFSWISDHFKVRAPCVMAGAFISGSGWLMGYLADDVKVRYAACFISAAGTFAAMAPNLALFSQNLGGRTKRAVGIGLIGLIAGLSGIIPSNIFMAHEAPRYRTAFLVTIGLNVVCFFGAAFMMVMLRRANAQKQRMIESGQAAGLTRQELADMGDASPYFRYTW